MDPSALLQGQLFKLAPQIFQQILVIRNIHIRTEAHWLVLTRKKTVILHTGDGLETSMMILNHSVSRKPLFFIDGDHI